MRLSYFPKSAARNSAPVIDALLQGFRLHGVQTDLESYNSDMVLLWSQLWAGRMKSNQEIYQEYTAKQRPVIVVDVGAIKRNFTWRISVNGTARLAGLGHDCSRRKKLGIELKPWRHHGQDVIIAMQRPDSHQWRGMPDPEKWLTDTVKTIRDHSARIIRVRAHPRFPINWQCPGVQIELPVKIPNTYDDYDFDQSILGAWAVINWNSTPGIISALHGLPVFVGNSSLAAPVANLDFNMIETPHMPDREQWANDLAWTEWTLEEIRQGIPQAYILQRINDRDKS
jgi:hypothetical protein